MVCVMRSGNGDKPFGGPLGSEKNEWEINFDSRSNEVMRMGTDVVWGLLIARRNGSKISLGWRYAAFEPSPD